MKKQLAVVCLTSAVVAVLAGCLYGMIQWSTHPTKWQRGCQLREAPEIISEWGNDTHWLIFTVENMNSHCELGLMNLYKRDFNRIGSFHLHAGNTYDFEVQKEDSVTSWWKIIGITGPHPPVGSPAPTI